MKNCIEKKNIICFLAESSHIKGGETAIGYHFELTRCPSPTQIPTVIGSIFEPIFCSAI